MTWHVILTRQTYNWSFTLNHWYSGNWTKPCENYGNNLGYSPLSIHVTSLVILHISFPPKITHWKMNTQLTQQSAHTPVLLSFNIMCCGLIKQIKWQGLQEIRAANRMLTVFSLWTSLQNGGKSTGPVTVVPTESQFTWSHQSAEREKGLVRDYTVEFNWTMYFWLIVFQNETPEIN